MRRILRVAVVAAVVGLSVPSPSPIGLYAGPRCSIDGTSGRDALVGTSDVAGMGGRAGPYANLGCEDTVAAIDDVVVAAGAAAHDILSASVAGIEAIAPSTTRQDIPPRVADKEVVAGTPANEVVASAAEETIVTPPP